MLVSGVWSPRDCSPDSHHLTQVGQEMCPFSCTINFATCGSCIGWSQDACLHMSRVCTFKQSSNFVCRMELGVRVAPLVINREELPAIIDFEAGDTLESQLILSTTVYLIKIRRKKNNYS